MRIRATCCAALVLVLAYGTLLVENDVSAQRSNVSAPGIIAEWRRQFPAELYVCWQKKSPWQGLNRLETPPEKVQFCKNLSVDMGRNEYESTSFVLTNLSERLLTFKLTHDRVGVSITLRKAGWVTVDDGSSVNDALSLIDGGRVVIPSGESLEIWITLHGNDVAAGNYQKRISFLPENSSLPDDSILPQDIDPRAIDISVTVHDISLPRTLPLDILHFDELVASWMTPELLEAYMQDLKRHYVNAAFVHPDPLPKLAVDAQGNLAMDYTELDQTLDGYQTLGPDKYIFFWGAENYLEPSGSYGAGHPESQGRPPFMTPPS